MYVCVYTYTCLYIPFCRDANEFRFAFSNSINSLFVRIAWQTNVAKREREKESELEFWRFRKEERGKVRAEEIRMNRMVVAW